MPRTKKSSDYDYTIYRVVKPGHDGSNDRDYTTISVSNLEAFALERAALAKGYRSAAAALRVVAKTIEPGIEGMLTHTLKRAAAEHLGLQATTRGRRVTIH